MGTYTGRLNLRKPDYTDIVNVDNDVNAAMQKIDDFINCSVCTSTTRPVWPNIFDGCLIYETDTENIYIWTGGATGNWTLIGNRKFGKGKIAYVPLAAGSATTVGTAEMLTGLNATFNAVAGRKYLVEFNYMLRVINYNGNTNFLNFGKIRWAAGASILVTSTLLGTRGDSVFSAAAVPQTRTKYWAIEFFPNITGQVTIGYTMTPASTATGQIPANGSNPDVYSAISVRDWGV